jgi:serine/threonine-protein kinase
MVWTRADGAGKPQPLTQSKTLQFPTSFTPDGTRLVFSELTPGGGAEIRTVPVESGSGQLRAGEPQLFLKTSTGNSYAAFSPDGRWLAYADAEAGSYEVYVRAFPDKGTKVQISNAGGLIPVWSRTARELFYRTEDHRIMVANYTVKGETFVADKPRVWFGKQLLANLGTAPSFDLAPDGKRFVVLMPAESPEPRETQSHVTLVVNFFDEVRRRVAAGRP